MTLRKQALQTPFPAIQKRHLNFGEFLFFNFIIPGSLIEISVLISHFAKPDFNYCPLKPSPYCMKLTFNDFA